MIKLKLKCRSLNYSISSQFIDLGEMVFFWDWSFSVIFCVVLGKNFNDNIQLNDVHKTCFSSFNYRPLKEPLFRDDINENRYQGLGFCVAKRFFSTIVRTIQAELMIASRHFHKFFFNFFHYRRTHE